MAKWQTIEENQPPPHETILFLCSNGDIYQGRPCYGMHAPWWCGHSKLNFGKVLEDEGLVVTHWMPLPKPPESIDRQKSDPGRLLPPHGSGP